MLDGIGMVKCEKEIDSAKKKHNVPHNCETNWSRFQGSDSRKVRQLINPKTVLGNHCWAAWFSLQV